MTKIRTYSELTELATFEERYRYLALRGSVGDITFGFDRYLNQQFYVSRQWRQIRQQVILRDNGCDLAVDGFDIFDRITIHHMNPVSQVDITSGDVHILDPELLITTTHNTHNAIHYGDERLLVKPPVDRRQGDTKLW